MGDLYSDHPAGLLEAYRAAQAVIRTAQHKNDWTDSTSFPRICLDFRGFPRKTILCIQSLLLRCVNVSDPARRQMTIVLMAQLL